MATLTNYHGLDVIDGGPTGAGGAAIQDNFTSLVDWNPKSVWDATSDPTAGDDELDEFYPGSMWLNTSTMPPKLFLCQDASTGAAVWEPLSWQTQAVPYTGATSNVDLGTKSLRSVGLDAGFSPAAPNPAASIRNFWFPRMADFNNGWMWDFHDEMAYRDKLGAVTTITPPPDAGAAADMYRDNVGRITYNAGTSPGTIVIDVNLGSNPITVKSNNSYALALTFRSSTALNPLPTHAKIEVESTTPSTYVTVFDGAIPQMGGYSSWVSPTWSSPASNINKFRLTLTVPSPLPGNLLIQRLMIYHPSATFDPWYLHVLGGSMLGPLLIQDHFAFLAQSAPGATPNNRAALFQDSADKSFKARFDNGNLVTIAPYAEVVAKTAAATLTGAESIVLCNTTSAAFTVTLPSASGIKGKQYTIKRTSGGANDLTIGTTASQTIDGSATRVLTTQHEFVTVVSDGANWFVVG